jgi:hypothetical protein
MLAGAKWRTVSWRSGTKGRLKARFAAVRVRIADGPPQRIWNKGQQHLPGVLVKDLSAAAMRSYSFEADRRSNGISSGTDEAGDRPGGDRSHDLSRCPEWRAHSVTGIRQYTTEAEGRGMVFIVMRS